MSGLSKPKMSGSSPVQIGLEADIGLGDNERARAATGKCFS